MSSQHAPRGAEHGGGDRQLPERGVPAPCARRLQRRRCGSRRSTVAGHAMPKSLWKVSYTKAGARGIAKEGGSSRREAVQRVVDSRPERPRGPDLFVGRNLLPVPVLDHTGVVLLDHRDAGTALLRDRCQRDARVHLNGDEARAQVARAGALGRGAFGSRGRGVEWRIGVWSQRSYSVTSIRRRPGTGSNASRSPRRIARGTAWWEKPEVRDLARGEGVACHVHSRVE